MSINSVSYNDSAPLAPSAPSVLESNISRRTLFQIRNNELCQKVKNFKNKLGMEKQPGLEIKGLETTPQAKIVTNITSQDKLDTRDSWVTSSSIILPSWFLLKFGDLPPYLHITNISDLNDENFLNEMNRWIHEKMKQLGLPEIDKQMDTRILTTLILLLQEPRFEQAKDFILAHEIAHISHASPDKLIRKQIIDALYETKADGTFAFKAPHLNLANPIQAVKELKTWVENVLNLTTIDQNGDHLFNDTHPPVSDRIAYLKM